jgi:hypothetical protein
MATLRNEATSLLCLMGFRSIRSVWQAVMNNIKLLLAMTLWQPEIHPR